VNTPLGAKSSQKKNFSNLPNQSKSDQVLNGAKLKREIGEVSGYTKTKLFSQGGQSIRVECSAHISSGKCHGGQRNRGDAGRGGLSNHRGGLKSG